MALTRKWFEVKIFTSNHFRTHAQIERERERSHPDHAMNPLTSLFFELNKIQLRLRLRIAPRSHPSTLSMNPEPRSRHEPKAQITPSTSPRSHPRIAPITLRSHRSHLRIAPRRHRSHRDHTNLSLSQCQD